MKNTARVVRVFAWLLFLVTAQLDHSVATSLYKENSVTLSFASASSELQTAAVGAHFALPYELWFEASLDRATENTSGFETTTNGYSLTLGTDPFAEYGIEVGGDTFGIADQYSVQQGRLRFLAMPDSFLGLSNPGFDVSLELRTALFQFANQPNPIFRDSTVSLKTQTARLEIAYYFLSRWSVFIASERTQLDSAFKELDRPLAPVFIPETAISTGLSWPQTEDLIGLSYSARKWGLRGQVARRTASVTGDQSQVAMTRFDYRWSRSFETGTRLSQSRSVTQSDLDPITTVALDLVFKF